MAGIIAAVLLFVMLFTVGTGYFMYVNQNNLLYTQALSNRVTNLQSSFVESLSLSTSVGSDGNLAVTVINEGAQASTIVGIFVISPSYAVTYVTTGASPALPLSVNAGVTSATIDTEVAYTTGTTYTVKVLTRAGSVFTATYPPTSTALAAMALTSGAIGDLYLQFSSFTFYTVACHSTSTNGCFGYGIISSSCPTSGSTNSGYCFDTNSGNTGPAFALSTSTYSNDFIGFSVTLTDFNTAHDDIILDQFSLIYESLFGYYWWHNAGFVPWYIVSVGTPTSGYTPILTEYTPVVLKYDVPTTVYFATSLCVTDSYGGNQNHANCFNSDYGSVGNGQESQGPQSICNLGYNYNCNDLAGSVATVFIIAHGWELSSGSYNVQNLAYSGSNYGQNAPFVTTLYY